VSAKPQAEETVKAPAKSKKLLIIVGGVVLILALAGGGAFYYISKQRAAADEGADAGEETTAKVEKAGPKTPPAYLPLDNMVVNLADPGGEKVAQVGIIFEVPDAHASDKVKAYLPTIRSGVLLLLAQRTSEELLKPEGKEKLAKDILYEASLPFGGAQAHDEPAPKAKKAKTKAKDEHAEMPVTRVLFSSFIVQ
jgi:flagellar FliL protein